MTAVALFHRDDARLPMKHAALVIWRCSRCGWQYDGKAGTVALYDQPPVLTEAGRPLSWRAATEVEGEDLTDPAGEGTKLGGFPWWIADGSIPHCDTCKQAMRFILQIGPKEIGYPPNSCGYVFLCLNEHQAKLVMQSTS